ncbi:MAG: gliding motility-associated C-terminal domain-containing protein [Chitinophagales bacterium]|nr:gliding motility-associated C-terminal domain-containing protein [Chitinophagales bacterium]
MKNYYFRIVLMLLLMLGGKQQLGAQNCARLYGSTNISANEFRAVKIDSLNGTLPLLSNLTSPNPISLPEGRMTIDPDDQKVYLVLNAQTSGSNTSYSLRVLDAQVGTQLGNFLLNNPIEGLQYDCAHNRLFGVEVTNNNALRLVEINTVSGAITPISANFFTTNNTNFYKATTLNSTTNTFSVLCLSNNNNYTVFHINTTNGNTTNFAFGVGSDAVVALEADKTNNLIYLLRQNNSNTQSHYLQSYNPTTNGTTNIGSPFNIVGSVAHQSAYDPYSNRFFFVSTSAVDRLYTVKTTSGNLLGNTTLEGVVFNLSVTVPCIAKPNFDFDNACAGEPIQFTDLSVGAETWAWNFGDPASGAANASTSPNPIHTFSSGGIFNVNLDISGCVGVGDTTLQINISQAATPTLPDSIVSCASSVVLDPGNFAGATYSWISGSAQQTITIANANPLWYWVDITTGNCTVRDSVFVNLSGGSSGVQIWNTPSQTICGETQTVLTTNGVVGTAYQWSTNAITPTINVTQSGTYSVTISTTNCTITDQLNITLVPPFNVAFSANESVCNGNKILDATNPGAAYQWSTGAFSPTITVSQSGTYTVTVSGSGCTSTATSQVSIIQLSLNLNTNAAGNLVVCNNPASADIVPTVNLSGTAVIPIYTWSTGDNTAQLSVPNGNNGVYTVTVSAATCSTQASANVQFITTTNVDLGSDQQICYNNSATLDAGVADSYTWSTGATTPQISVTQSGTYTVTVSNSACTATDDVVVTVVPATPIDFNVSDPNVCTLQDDVLVLNAGAGQSYSWSPNGEITPTITVSDAGEYAVTVTDAAGCTNTQTITIGNQCRSVLIFPNAFSPNEDFVNDLFQPIYQFIEDYHLEVYNIYGNQVFVSDNLDLGWDGTTLKSKKLPIGVYVWFAYYTDNLGNRYKQQGNVTLIR